jgi:hypothetical protein
VIKHLLVRGARGDFRDCDNVVARFTECPDYRPGTTFIGQEVHASGVGGRRRRWAREENDFFVGNAGCAVGHGGADVLGGEMGVVLEQFGFGGALGEFAEDQLYSDARSANHRLAHHYGWVDVDSLCGHT